MYKKELVIAYLVLVVVTVSIIAYIFTRVALPGVITGAISAQGGYITGINVSTESGSQHWASRFGEITVDSGSNYTYSTSIATGSITELNLTLGCMGEELYASTSTISDWSLITAGTTGLVDSYLQLSPGASESAASMFTESEVYLVKDNSLSIPVTHTLAQGSNPNVFELGILNYSNAIVMVTSVVANQVGFDGRTHDYQMLLPTINEQATYYFFSDCATEEEEPPPSPGGGGGGGAISPVFPVKKEKIEEKGEKREGEEKPEELPADIITEAVNIILKEQETPTEAVKTTSFQPPLAGKAWGIGIPKKFALYFFPLTLMTMVMLILVLLLFWVKKRQRKRDGKDFKLQHNSKGKR